MRIPLYQLDAFTDRRFHGNPAAICPLEQWLPDSTLQAIAAENNLSETAYYVPAGAGADADFELRWFTPGVEVDLCGHATLATAVVALDVRREICRSTVRIQNQIRNVLAVHREGDRYAMDFPSRPPAPCARLPRSWRRWASRRPKCSPPGITYAFMQAKAKCARSPGHGEARGPGPVWDDRDGSGLGLRFRIAIFRSRQRRSGGSGDRFLTLHADSLLGEAPR